MGQGILRDVLIIFLFSIPFILLIHQLKLPAIIGFLLTGTLIGPFGLRLIEDIQRIDLLAEIGVALLLFAIGLEFSLETLSKLKTYVLKGGTLQILFCIVAGTIIGLLLDWPFNQGLFFGCVIALSSTAVVLASLVHHRFHDSIQGRIATGILILQDLAVVPMIALLPSLSDGKKVAAWNEIVQNIGNIVILLLLTLLASRYLVRHVLRLILKTRSRELFLITVMTFALGMAWFTDLLGLSFALGAFLGGFMIGATDYQSEALSEITPFRYAFSSLFFVSIGMLLNLEFLKIHLPTVFLLVLLIPTLKTILTAASLLLCKAPLRIAVNVGILLGQIGEFSFLLATVGRSTGAIDFKVYQYIIATAVVTMFGTPLMTQWSSFITDKIVHLRGLRRFNRIGMEKKLEQTVAHHSNHVIVCGFGALGGALGHLLDQYHIPHVILELNPETIEKIRERKKEVFFGDGTSEDILYRSGIERARMLAITIPDFLNNTASIRQARRLNPEIKIITRAKYRKEVPALYDAGADVVISEELEGGIEMGRYALKMLDVPCSEVDAYILKIREFGSADFF